MNKNTLSALLLGTSLLGCNSPIGEKPDGNKILYIPAECKEIVSLDISHSWTLLCKDDKGKEFFYSAGEGPWQRYEIERK